MLRFRMFSVKYWLVLVNHAESPCPFLDSFASVKLPRPNFTNQILAQPSFLKTDLKTLFLSFMNEFYCQFKS